MTEFTLSVPCLFGLEGLCAQELRRLEMKEVAAENGRVLFKGTFEDIIRANLWLRTGERVLLRLASFPARTFEELFQGVYHTPLEAIIPKNGAFPVKGHCLGSQLHSVPDCQAIVTGLDNFCPNCGCSLKASPKVQYALVLKSALTSPEDNLTLYQICEREYTSPPFPSQTRICWGTPIKSCARLPERCSVA